ncbi:MAG: hypothetical protein IJO21_06995 [Oscillospiraceae bacterium]|nr:hypothetical protein [Oscillospiraceae bacterium]
MEKQKMQVLNGENFIFDLRKRFFGGLYKMGKLGTCFLNIFTPCNLHETALQFLYIMQKYGHPAAIIPGFGKK